MCVCVLFVNHMHHKKVYPFECVCVWGGASNSAYGTNAYITHSTNAATKKVSGISPCFSLVMTALHNHGINEVNMLV